MNKISVVLNDFGANVKSLISYDRPDIKKLLAMWDEPDERIIALHVLPPFAGYERWSELTPDHYRILITRSLNALSKLSQADRADTSLAEVTTTNFLVLAFMICLERATCSEIEHFRINRYDDLNVTFDYSAAFEVEYERPKPKVVPAPAEPAFSIVIDNSED